VETGAPDTEIRAALSPADRNAIPVAIYAVDQELRRPTEDEQVALAMMLGRQIGLLKMGAPAEMKEEWIALALDEIGHLPTAMVEEALRGARRKVRFEGEVVPFVLEEVEPKVAKLRRERERLQELQRVAG
jgi:hypothetical protein